MSATEAAATAGRPGMSQAEISAMVSKLVQDGQAQAKLEQLFEDNFQLRNKNTKLTTDLEAATTKVPKDGDLVLTGDDVALFNEAKATGKNAKQLKELVKEHGDLSTKVVDLERKTKVAEIAEAENWKPAVLERLTQGMDLLGVETVSEEIADEEAEGGKKKVDVKRGYINVKDGANTVKKKLVEELADFLPSLSKAEAEADENAGKGGGSGTPLPRMSRGDKVASGGTKGVSADFINKRYGKSKE